MMAGGLKLFARGRPPAKQTDPEKSNTEGASESGVVGNQDSNPGNASFGAEDDTAWMSFSGGTSDVGFDDVGFDEVGFAGFDDATSMNFEVQEEVAAAATTTEAIPNAATKATSGIVTKGLGFFKNRSAARSSTLGQTPVSADPQQQKPTSDDRVASLNATVPNAPNTIGNVSNQSEKLSDMARATLKAPDERVATAVDTSGRVVVPPPTKPPAGKEDDTAAPNSQVPVGQPGWVARLNTTMHRHFHSSQENPTPSTNQLNKTPNSTTTSDQSTAQTATDGISFPGRVVPSLQPRTPGVPLESPDVSTGDLRTNSFPRSTPGTSIQKEGSSTAFSKSPMFDAAPRRMDAEATKTARVSNAVNLQGRGSNGGRPLAHRTPEATMVVTPGTSQHDSSSRFGENRSDPNLPSQIPTAFKHDSDSPFVASLVQHTAAPSPHQASRVTFPTDASASDTTGTGRRSEGTPMNLEASSKIPPSQTEEFTFDDLHAEFLSNLRDLEDDQNANSSKLLQLTGTLASEYATVLHEQAKLLDIISKFERTEVVADELIERIEQL